MSIMREILAAKGKYMADESNYRYPTEVVMDVETAKPLVDAVNEGIPDGYKITRPEHLLDWNFFGLRFVLWTGDEKGIVVR